MKIFFSGFATKFELKETDICWARESGSYCEKEKLEEEKES